MASRPLTDAQLALVAGVAEREGWRDLNSPPVVSDGPRSVAEQMAVSQFASALPGARRSAPALDPRMARIIMIVAGLVGLGACWWISPGRTALGLLFAGVFSLWSLRRRRRGAGTYPGLSAPRKRLGGLRPF